MSFDCRFSLLRRPSGAPVEQSLADRILAGETSREAQWIQNLRQTGVGKSHSKHCLNDKLASLYIISRRPFAAGVGGSRRRYASREIDVSIPRCAVEYSQRREGLAIRCRSGDISCATASPVYSSNSVGKQPGAVLFGLSKHSFVRLSVALIASLMMPSSITL